MALKRTIWRQFLRLRFHLFQKHRFNQLVLERVDERPLLILPDVFNPTLFLTSNFMVQSFNQQLIPPGSFVLDMGTGSGIGAVFAAQWASQVIAVDVNPAAVRCARINALINDVDDKVEVRESDLFTAVPEQFDVIIFNPPYFPGKPTSLLDHAFHANDVIERFAAQLGDHLRENGRLLLLLSTDAPIEAILHQFTQVGMTANIAAQKKIPSETILLYQLHFSD